MESWRYLRLYWMLVKIGLMRQMAYRPHFFLMITGKVIRMALLFFFFQAVFLKVDRIGRWNYDQVLLLFATFQVVDYLISISYQRNLASHLPRRIQTGELDARLILPVNTLFFTAFEDVDLFDFFSFIPALGFLGYVLYRMKFNFTWLQAVNYVLLLVNALLFLFAILLMIGTVSFWTTQSYGLARIFDNVMKIGRYPLDIFSGFWKAIFLYLLPLVLIAQLPSQALLESLSFWTLTLAFAVSGLFLSAALLFWKAGLKNYLSTSS
jgi:ABC-2 type transport system permease protein